jgi:pyruvate/2-oxoglutarate dehydrogenase complex dihydrolipoamide dehydrogenase (E3) component
VAQALACDGSKVTIMARSDRFSNPMDKEIYELHRRYIQVMENERLAAISDGTKAHYLRVLKSLTDKLAIPGKPLSEVVGEIMSEAAPLLFQTMQR